tara:strand:- start:4114 stop:5292 length:1179 start_codon:yes stop_codon:yes gene_type:complete
MKKDFHDIIILGAGLTGLILSLSLAKLGIRVCIIDKNDPNKTLADERTTAISKGSSNFLDDLKIWSEIKSKAQKIKKIFVSEGVSNNGISFDCKSVNSEAMGYIIENKILKKKLLSAIEKNSLITFIKMTEIKKIERTNSNLNIFKLISRDKVFQCNLLIGADGRYSKIRSENAFKYLYQDYRQIAYVFSIKHKEPHGSLALERFFPSGPLAILPMKKGRQNQSSVVWTLENNLSDISEENLKNLFEKKYSNYFGKLISMSTPVKYKLNLFSCYQDYKNGIILVGDASQAIHPIAGQGFNLGLRDVKILSEILAESKALGFKSSCELVHQKYSRKRKLDKFLLISSTHLLNKLFSINNKSLGFFRSLGLRLFNKSNFLKRNSILYAMGLKNF